MNANDSATPNRMEFSNQGCCANSNAVMFGGFTKRELIAAMMAQGILASNAHQEMKQEIVASWAVQQTDALIAELSKEKP